MTVTIQLRRGNASEWTEHNPTLAPGEMGVEIDTGQFKVGIGEVAWNDLPYSSGDDGVDGADGSKWFVGEGEPGEDFGVTGDFYLDSENGDVYEKGESEWSQIINIMGPAGALPLRTLHTLEDATGDIHLDFASNPVYVVHQGADDIAYSLPSLTVELPAIFEGWDLSVWDLLSSETLPTLLHTQPPSE